MDNSDVTIEGRGVVLVPYSAEYVETYHAWMCRPELLELTCSEPLSLEEEFRNQKEWLESGDKLTFIILAGDAAGVPVGDCNLFLLMDAASDEEATEEGQSIEVEVMVAETEHRGKGLATEALRLIMKYAVASLSPKPVRFVAKILEKNAPSKALFEKIGFKVFKEVKAFEEIHYELLHGSEEWTTFLE